MVNVSKRTGHSSYYVEKGMSAAGMTMFKQNTGDSRAMGGGKSKFYVLQMIIVLTLY